MSRKFVFVEFNQTGMEWMVPEESPTFCLLQADSPEAALQEWVEDHSHYFTEEHIQEEINPGETFASLRERWGVDVRMFEIKADLTPKLWDWMEQVVKSDSK